MFKGHVDAIHITAQAGEEPQGTSAVEAVAGQGLTGDRNFGGAPHAAVTLIEAEALDALTRDYGVTLAPGASRRNITTRGVPLNHLVGRTFRVGAALLRGTELCEPCSYLAGKTEQKVLPGLIHRGGIRAEVLAGGMIRPGDVVEPAADDA